MSFDINSMKRKLLIQYPMFGSVTANLNYVEDINCLSNGLPTASVDGVTMRYHPDFIDGLTDDEQTFIFAHEIAHVALNHIKRGQNKDPDTWNIAVDAVINANLVNDGLPLVKGGVDMPDAINYDAEELYLKLLENKKDNNNGNGNSNSNGKNSFNNMGHDSHESWYKECDKVINDSSNSCLSKKLKEEITTNSQFGEKEVFKNNSEQRNKMIEEYRDSLAKKITGGEVNFKNIDVGEIGNSTNLVDWRRLLKENAKANFDWSYRNAEIEYGVLTPRLEKIPTSKTEIVLDTSGSINKTLLRNFLKECKNILRNSEIEVGCFDTRFYGFNKIRRESDIYDMEFLGGGGTNFDVAVEAFSKRVDNRIIFTDGYASMPKDNMNIIWIVFGNNKINPPGGKVIYISEDALNQLQYNTVSLESSSKRV